MKTATIDSQFSKLVRERSNYVCDCCHIDYRYQPEKLHCSHLFGRRHRTLRWFPWNAFAHCFKCHKHFTDEPAGFKAWAKRKLPDGVYETLEVVANTANKVTPEEVHSLHKHYIEELKRLEGMRANGVIGKIQFTFSEWGNK